MGLDRGGGLSADLAEVGDRAVWVKIKQYAHCVSRALVELRGFHVLTLRG